MEWICLLIGLFIGYLLGVMSAVGGQPSDSVGMFFHNALLQTGQNEEVHYIVSRTSFGDDGGESDPVPDPVVHKRWSNN
jgi:hypothetical protein